MPMTGCYVTHITSNWNNSKCTKHPLCRTDTRSNYT